jgi:hypothetical protein
MQSGVNFRDATLAVVEQNKVFSNFYQFSCRGYSKDESAALLKNNEVTGDNEFGGDCTIF